MLIIKGWQHRRQRGQVATVAMIAMRVALGQQL